MSIKDKIDQLQVQKNRQEAESKAESEARFQTLLKQIEQRSLALNSQARAILSPLLDRMNLGYEILDELARSERLNTELVQRKSWWSGYYEYVRSGVVAKPCIHLEVIHSPVVLKTAESRVPPDIRAKYEGKQLVGGFPMPSKAAGASGDLAVFYANTNQWVSFSRPLESYLVELNEIDPRRFSIGDCYTMLNWNLCERVDEGGGPDLTVNTILLRYKFSAKPEARIEVGIAPPSELEWTPHMGFTQIENTYSVAIPETQWTREVIEAYVAHVYFPFRGRQLAHPDPRVNGGNA